jgi:putative oxidoreductase
MTSTASTLKASSPKASSLKASAAPADYVSAFGRLLIAAIFLWSGWRKLAMAKGVIAMIAAAHLPFPEVGYGLALAAELGAGSLFLLGWRTRIWAAALAVFTLATALIFHSHASDNMQLTNFMKNLSMMGGLLQVAAFGGGALSLDGWLARRAS